MKAPAILSLVTLFFSSTVFAAPSQALIKDLKFELHDDTTNNRVQIADDKLSGRYVIRSSTFDDDSNFFIGRGLEDLSLLPKRVKTVDRLSPYAQLVWNVKPLDNGHYILGVGRGVNGGTAPTTQINGQLFATIIDGTGPPPVEWIVIYQEQFDAYTIVSANDNYQGWVANSDENSPVEVKPLIVGPSDPPFYPPSELFKFYRASDDDDMIGAVIDQKSQDIHVDVKISVEF